jgi:deoxyadenosine/deoxycytidine kinase
MRPPPPDSSPPRIIAVAGNIGSGKSSLVAWLCQQFGLDPFFEPHADNPYLADFYQDMRRWALSSQLWFLLRRFEQHRAIEQAGKPVVQDRTIFEDAEVFAANLHEQGAIDDRDWDLYRSAYRTLRAELRPPDLLVYLRCNFRTLRRRIKLRGRDYEAALPAAYLKRLDRLYERWFASWDASPTLVVNTDELDYVENLFDRRDLLGMVNDVLRPLGDPGSGRRAEPASTRRPERRAAGRDGRS